MFSGPRAFRLLLALGLALLLAAATLSQFGAGRVPDTLQGVLWGLGAGVLFSAALRRYLPDGCDSSTPTQRRRYLREFLPPMAGYVLAVFLSVWLLKRVDGYWPRVALALLPMPPIALAMRAIIRHIRDADELQRRIELEAVSLATVTVSLLFLAGGFLQRAKLIEISGAVAMIWVFPLICLGYGIAKILVSRRYS